MSSSIEESVDVDVSAAKAYQQWMRYEDFPKFMEAVESVSRVGAKELEWKAEVGGKTQEWIAEITEEIPEKRVAWASRTGAHNAGAVTFHPLDTTKTRIMLQLEYDPEGVVENVGDALGVMTHRVKGDLENFKKLMEQGA